MGKYWGIVLALAITAQDVNAKPTMTSQCRWFLSDILLNDGVLGEIKKEETSEVFEYWDVKNGFGLRGEVQKESLSFDVELRNDHYRSQLSGTKLFAKMMRHFESQGKRITEIYGDWRSGDNLRIFEESRKQGSSLEASALSTWTGKQAQKFGFNRVAFFEERLVKGKKQYVVIFVKESE